MYQALYRKYRPSTFEDVCGQEHITSVLKTQLQKGRVSHAYIFCGSRGTGKTTCAKILARAVNCENPQNGEPCNACSSCLAIQEERVLDVVEMDAASNNGVDHIRRLCDEVQFLPSEAKKRVYIIDEVHMLSTSAFNALLKTIEEPPTHVLFILATTEVNDIPATIMSRCQRFDFKRITPNVVADRLMKIAAQENINLMMDAANVIARLSDGAMRDALSLLEACQGYNGKIDSDTVHSILGISSRSTILDLCEAIALHDVDKALQMVQAIYKVLSDFKEVIAELIGIYRDLLVIRSVSDYRNYIDCYENELERLEKIAPLLSLETILFQSGVLEDFYVSYDRIATGKKAASEILMIRLCKEELSNDVSALLSRIAKLEKAVLNGVSFQSPKEYAEQKVSEAILEEGSVEPIKIPEKVSFKSNSLPGTFVGAVKLKNLLQREAFLKPWLAQLEFTKNGTVLVLKTGSFVKGILVSANAQDLILNAAKQVDSDITTVVFEEKEQNSSSAHTSGLEDL